MAASRAAAAAAAAAPAAFTTTPSPADPHRYQTGFGNRFASEAVPGVLPVGRNVPQRVKYGLYSEQLNGAAVVSPRDAIQHVWMYRMRPSVAHGRVSPVPGLNPHIESCFSRANDKVEFVASQEAWDPFPLLEKAHDDDGAGVDFVSGIRTVGGQGDPTLRQGLAVHIYSANASMTRRAFCNNDGDLLVLPQHGRLHVQTELGWLMVRPGELLVVQAGLRFRVLLPDGPSRGYIQEVFGAHYRLPELGPVGSNGMALPRDFEHPMASFDLDDGEGEGAPPWDIVYKLAGGLHSCRQAHTPFDVVAWHGNLAPYKYALDRFVNLANANHDQADPTIYCVLTAGGGGGGGPSLTDVLIFTKKWLTAEDTFRPPYYHRNMSTEVMGLIRGRYGGSSHGLGGGGLSYEASYMPHGEAYATWREATTRALRPETVCDDATAFMFHIGAPLYLTRWALRGEGAATRHGDGEEAATTTHKWDDVRAHFLDHLDDVDADLRAAGLPSLVRRSPEKLN
ncbi:Homogentisate 1,2-dioxygenase [Purpureocillium takamizusanense]|uniref:homogentisate 1,2-dioxygenase n=1 Tax=Purpureocillium takamizusanense TaxID=2060973 RepID=A0A9Q8QRE9_9HYPO|nr:Homogentisate 1,2-dioxygenase [Purpureocillium takamizusanense]UNI24027.1 Homogentisate 1,2-dioxygenase [Purpureocillium takamizusanense]